MAADGEALDLALALQRAPLQRFELQDRPLPADIGSVIQLAAGNPELLAAAAARLGVSEAGVLEAVRFYLQQVLFAADADAWRTLGLEPDAAPERIRQHYRWLQSWLHPDRQDQEWVALYTTRVNQAWNQLRNPKARAAYALQQAAAVEVADASEDGVRAVGEWRAVPAGPPPSHWRSKLLVGASLGACALLLVLVLVRESGEPVDRDPVRIPLVSAADDQTPPDAQAAAPVEGTDAAAPAVAHEAEASRLLAAALHEATQARASVASTPSNEAALPVRAMTPPATLAPSPPMPRPGVVDAAPSVILPPPPPAALSAPAPAPPAPALAIAASAPASDQVHARPEALDRGAPRSVASTPPPPAVAMPPAAVVHSTSRTAPVAASPARTDPPATPRVSASASTAAMRPTGSAARVDAASAPAAVVAHASTPPPRPQPVASPEVSVASVAAPALAAIEPAPGSIVPAAAVASIQRPVLTVPPSSAELVRRVDLARQRVQDIAGYFSRADATPADWRDADARPHLGREQQALQRRARMGDGSTPFTLASPRWRVSAETAAVDAAYSVAGESGTLSVEMVWQDRAWHVTRIELRPAP